MNLNEDQLDVLTEMVTIGIGRAASSLSEMVDCQVDLDIPSLRLLAEGECLIDAVQATLESLSIIEQGFEGSFNGLAALAIPENSAQQLVTLLLGGEASAEEMQEERVPVLTEVGNILINGLMGSLGNILANPVDYKVPTFHQGTFTEIAARWDDRDTSVLVANVHFSVSEGNIQGHFILVFEVASMALICERIDQMLAG